MTITALTSSELGKKSQYYTSYSKEMLFFVPRNLNKKYTCFGTDLFNAYELSWLDLNGKPDSQIAVISYSSSSPFIVESKSLKLYLNSFSNTRFKNTDVVSKTISKDLSEKIESEVSVKILTLDHELFIGKPEGICIDTAIIRCMHFETPDGSLLKTEDKSIVTETLYSNLLKSNCPITNQPDWATVSVHYTGYKIINESLLEYIISFRNHNELHEECADRIFMDIMEHCMPSKLTIYARYTRRGGIDINPFRTTEKNVTPSNKRLIRQ